MYQVLLVDDEPTILLSLRNLIDWEKEGYRIVATAGNGEEALAYIQRGGIELIITDLIMPVMDGLELISKVQKINKKIPILVLSNYSDFDLVRQALTEGATDYLLKLNISKEQLLGCLEKMAKKVEIQEKNRLAYLERKKRLEKAEFKNVLLAEDVFSQENLSQLEAQLLPYLPARMLCFYFDKNLVKREKMEKMVKPIQDFIQLVFTIKEVVCSMVLHQNEILVLMSEYKDKSQEQISAKMNRITKQIKAYFSYNCRLLYTDVLESAEDILRQYEWCYAQVRQFRSIDKTESLLVEEGLKLQEGIGNKKQAKDVLLFLEKHYKEKITLEDIAESVSHDKSYVCRIFKKEYGCSIFACLNKIRMEKGAEIMKKNSKVYIQDVSSMVGMDSSFYFTRRFKEYFGVSPKEYMNQINEELEKGE